MDPVASFTIDTFEGRVGDRFGLLEEQVELELIAATFLGEGVDVRAGGAFTLLFRGPGDAPLAQGIRALSHAALGDFALFLVPVAGDAAHRDYEAVFA